jgi:hypothetical protein
MIFMGPPHGISAPVRQGAFVERRMAHTFIIPAEAGFSTSRPNVPARSRP